MHGNRPHRPGFRPESNQIKTAGAYRYVANVTENPRTAAKYRIMSLPTLMFFKNGEAVNTVVGAVAERALTPKLEEIL